MSDTEAVYLELIEQGAALGELKGTVVAYMEGQKGTNARIEEMLKELNEQRKLDREILEAQVKTAQAAADKANARLSSNSRKVKWVLTGFGLGGLIGGTSLYAKITTILEQLAKLK